MPDRFEYAAVRQKIIDAVRTDLMGPQCETEVLDENPKHAYIIGMLISQSEADREKEGLGEQEIDADVVSEDGEDYTAGEEDDNEPISVTHFQLPSSIGISFYVEERTSQINLEIRWGDYEKSTEKRVNKDGKEISVATYTRNPMKEILTVDFSSFERTKDFQLVFDPNVHVYVSRIHLKNGYSLVTAYVINKRHNAENDVASMMFQVVLKAFANDGSRVFVAEHVCREVLEPDEFYFEQRPILGRGRGCAAIWGDVVDGKAEWVQSDFIPQYEFPGVSPALKGLDRAFFSMRVLAAAKRKDDIITRLTSLADSYDQWIQTTLVADHKMHDADFSKKIGDNVVSKCTRALNRIREGIMLLKKDDTAFDAFCFMNRAMILQRNIMK